MVNFETIKAQSERQRKIKIADDLKITSKIPRPTLHKQSISHKAALHNTKTNIGVNKTFV
jgi:hypothetical protein